MFFTFFLLKLFTSTFDRIVICLYIRTNANPRAPSLRQWHHPASPEAQHKNKLIHTFFFSFDWDSLRNTSTVKKKIHRVPPVMAILRTKRKSQGPPQSSFGVFFVEERGYRDDCERPSWLRVAASMRRYHGFTLVLAIMSSKASRPSITRRTPNTACRRQASDTADLLFYFFSKWV